MFLNIDSGNADGLPTPPLLVFTGKRMPNQINAILPEGWVAAISESGWMNTDVFYDYITKTFHPWLLKNGINLPVVLFVDGHVSHRSLRLSEFCYENQIVLISLLPNTTHMCQPMDVVVFGPTKRKWSTILQNFKIENREERMTKAKFCELLKNCVDESLTDKSLKSAFSKTALFPFIADDFDYSQLATDLQETVEKRYELPERFIYHLE